jgi:hypothetical protein
VLRARINELSNKIDWCETGGIHYIIAGVLTFRRIVLVCLDAAQFVADLWRLSCGLRPVAAVACIFHALSTFAAASR